MKINFCLHNELDGLAHCIGVPVLVIVRVYTMLEPYQVMGQFSKHSHVNTQYRSNQVLSFIKHP